jgi:hypothetical protein
MSFRILDQAPQYRLNNGAVNVSGSLTFYETDLTTLKNTWSDEALTTLNSNPVLLGSDGRTVTDVWGDGEYGVVIKDALGATVRTLNNVRANEPQVQTIPDGEAIGDLLQWDGSAWVATEGILVPDPTDLNNHQLVSDGSSVPVWEQKPEAPEIPDPEIVIVDTEPYSVRIGVSDDTTKVLRQYGSGTCPASPGSRTSSVTITPSVAFDKVLAVIITPRTDAVGVGVGGTFSTDGYTIGSPMSSFSVTVNSVDDGGDSNYTIENAWDFDWCVEGTVTVEAEE